MEFSPSDRRRGPLGRAIGIIPAACLLALPLAAAAATNPTALTQYGTIVGTGATLTLTRLPTTNATGKVSYYDVTITLSVGSTGVLSTTAQVASVKSPALVTGHFQAGRYFVKCSNTAYFGTLSSGVGSGGSTVWTLLMDTAVGCGYPRQSVWQTGNPVPDIAARLRAAKVPNNPEYSYGYTASAGVFPFYNNGLLATAQVNGNLSLISYTYGSTDEPSQVGSVVMTLCTDKACSNSG